MVMKESFQEDMDGTGHAVSVLQNKVVELTRENSKFKSALKQALYKIDAIKTILHTGYPVEEDAHHEVGFRSIAESTDDSFQCSDDGRVHSTDAGEREESVMSTVAYHETLL